MSGPGVPQIGSWKCAIITGADQGIGRAVAVLYAQEGADVAIVYSRQDAAAKETQRLVETAGRRCLLIRGDVGDPSFCKKAVERTVKELGGLDILVSDADSHKDASPRGTPFSDILPDASPGSLSDGCSEQPLLPHIYGYFYMAKACLPHLHPGSAIIATGAGPEETVSALTRLLAKNLMSRGIRVNAVAPATVWARLPQRTEIEQAAQPEEIAPAYVFLASNPDSSYITGQVLPAMGSATSV